MRLQPGEARLRPGEAREAQAGQSRGGMCDGRASTERGGKACCCWEDRSGGCRCRPGRGPLEYGEEGVEVALVRPLHPRRPRRQLPDRAEQIMLPNTAYGSNCKFDSFVRPDVHGDSCRGSAQQRARPLSRGHAPSPLSCKHPSPTGGRVGDVTHHERLPHARYAAPRDYEVLLSSRVTAPWQQVSSTLTQVSSRLAAPWLQGAVNLLSHCPTPHALYA